jgi:glycosyltransferase involved in cell wall biosynthesis
MLHCYMDATREKIPASVGILTLNNVRDLPRALESVEAFDDLYICDGNSTDGTQDIARSHGARVVKQVETDEPMQKITDFGAVRTLCWKAAKYDWYFRLDSDEYLSPGVAEEIRAIVADPNPPFRVYKIPRKYVWRGNVIDDTITYPNRQIRFFRRDAVDGYTKITHEAVVVHEREPVGFLKSPMLVPMSDSFEEFDKSRTVRALDWDRRHYEATMTPRKWFGALIFTSATIVLFTARLARVRLISRGNKFPFRYEWWRYTYQFQTMWLATKVLFGKLMR